MHRIYPHQSLSPRWFAPFPEIEVQRVFLTRRSIFSTVNIITCHLSDYFAGSNDPKKLGRRIYAFSASFFPV